MTATDPRDLQARLRGAGAGLNPAVSVVIPTHDRTDTLGRVLDAYAHQTIDGTRFEVVVVDDASAPDTAALVAATVDRPDGLPYPLRYLWHAPNGGPGAARNAGIADARAPIVVLGCDDTIPAPELLAEHLAAHAARPSKLVAVIGAIQWAPEADVNRLMRYVTDESGSQYAFFQIADRENAGYGCFYGSNVSLKRSLLLEQDVIFDPAFTYGYEDTDLGYRLEKQGVRLVYHPPAVVSHCHHYTLESFCRRMYRVGTMAPVLARKHPELSHLMYGDDPSRVFTRRDFDGLVPLIGAVGAAIAEIEKIDPGALSIVDWNGDKLGRALLKARHDLYQHAFSEAYAAGIAEGLERGAGS